jgi:HEAT repeat protein
VTRTSASLHAAGRGRPRRSRPAALLFALASTVALPLVATGGPPSPPPVGGPVVASRGGDLGPSLRQLAAHATAVVLASVERVESADEDALRIYHVRPLRVLAGRLDETDVAVVELRNATQRPPLLTEGEQVVLVLQPAPPYSWLRERLPEGRTLAVAGGRSGVVHVGSDAEVDAIARALADGAAIAKAEPDAAAVRRLAFDELASASPRLATDALVELHGVAGLEPLAPAEVDALRRTFRDPRVDVVTRAGLMDLLAARDVRSALPALRDAALDGPVVLDAAVAARSRLGEPPTRAMLEPYLRAPDAAMRAAAVRALGRVDGPETVRDLARYATAADGDPAVREAAIEALGATARPEAAHALAETFQSTDRATSQASARALMALDSPAADDALVDVALHGRTVDARKYAAVVLMAQRGRTHPAVRRILAGDPGPEVRDVLEHGLTFTHTHQHNAE